MKQIMVKQKQHIESEVLVNAGYPVNEYLLVLQPHEELWNSIMKIKEEFAKDFKCSMAFGTKPHVTLAKFVQYEMMESRIINRLQLIRKVYLLLR